MTTVTRYPDDLTLLDARTRYFADNGFGATGGYDDKWVPLAIAGLTIPFPNTKARARAVRYHDLHHILTGYGTDFASEAVISAWELGAGCGRNPAPWVINLAGMGAGLLTHPRRTYAGFVRGRHSASLYDRPYDPMLAETVGAARARTHTPPADARPKTRGGDAVAFSGAVIGCALALPLVTAVTIALLPLGLAALAAKRTTAASPRSE